MISIDQIRQNQFTVTVDSKIRTTHQVTIQPDDYDRLTAGKASREDLLRASFQFLLERESNTSILDEFDLMTIQRYFPEFEREMKSRFHPG